MKRNDPGHELHHPAGSKAADEALRRLEVMRAELENSRHLVDVSTLSSLDERLQLLVKTARMLRGESHEEARLRRLRELADGGNQ